MAHHCQFIEGKPHEKNHGFNVNLFSMFFIFKCYEWKNWFTALFCDFYQMYLEVTLSFFQEKMLFHFGVYPNVDWFFIGWKNKLIVFYYPFLFFQQNTNLKIKRTILDNTAVWLLVIFLSFFFVRVESTSYTPVPPKTNLKRFFSSHQPQALVFYYLFFFRHIAYFLKVHIIIIQ